jgi:uncharacterized protein YbjT (DUF2867 family)
VISASAQHRNAIDAARAAGVRHILYTSFIDVAADSPAEFAAVHRTTEAELAASGVQFTALRNPLYADFLPMNVAAAFIPVSSSCRQEAAAPVSSAAPNSRKPRPPPRWHRHWREACMN